MQIKKIFIFRLVTEEYCMDENSLNFFSDKNDSFW